MESVIMDYKERNKIAVKKYRTKNKEKYNQYMRSFNKEKRINRPWVSRYHTAKDRCENSNSKAYKYYGGKGVKMLLRINDIKNIWIRDNASSMRKPSLDRINSDGNYELSNCRFIELRINSGRFSREKTHCKYGHEFTKENTLIYADGRRRCAECRKRERNAI